MEEPKKTILVPTDFSDTAELAIQYGTDLAKRLGLSITLLHIFENMPMDEATRKMIRSQFIFRQAADRLKERAEKITAEFGLVSVAEIKEGSIFEHIGAAASEFGALMVVMGTHGTKGVQHMVGSFAAKVIESTPVPLLAVQKGSDGGVSLVGDIVIPVDIYSDLGQVRAWGAYFGNTLDARVHLLDMADETAASMGNYGVNIQATRNELSANLKDLVFEVIRCAADDVADEVLSYAKECNAAMIAVSQRPDGNKFALGEQEQKILLNQGRIPVVCFDSHREVMPG